MVRCNVDKYEMDFFTILDTIRRISDSRRTTHRQFKVDLMVVATGMASDDDSGLL
ncbi:hypothetical protein PS6_011592, partial [Mucor atramentarius]